MHQAHAEIWNEIAKTEKLATEWGRRMFSKTQQELETSLEHQGKLLAKAGHAPGVAVMYQALTPLILEREAITAYISRTDRPDLRAAMPEINSPAEGLMLAAKAYRLNKRDLSDLETMLTKLRWPANETQTAE